MTERALQAGAHRLRTTHQKEFRHLRSRNFWIRSRLNCSSGLVT